MTVVGIDLGTTNTVVGVVRHGQATTLRDAEAQYLIPSVVSFHPNGSVLVGRAALERRLVDATNTVYSVKRLIGRSWGSDEVQQARRRFPFQMKEGPGQAALVVARGESFTLPEISAFVLRHARGLAEHALGETVDRAVITVPANFNDLQRAATKVAGRVAGLEVMRILNEPTAAALAYGYGRGVQERIAIYDFGGGTFDITLLDLSGNVFEVLATAGNTFLGGDDIDFAIAQAMANACLQRHRFDPRTDPQSLEMLRVAAERLKIALSQDSEHTERIPDIGHGTAGRALDLVFSMTRAEFDKLAAPIVERTFDVCVEALGIARLKPDAFDQVILVGGSTRLGLVRDRVAEFFGREPLEHVSPDEVVAIGAAIQANALTGADRRRAPIPQPPMPALHVEQPGRREPLAHSKPPPLPQRKTQQQGAPPGRIPLPGGGRARQLRSTAMGIGPPPGEPFRTGSSTPTEVRAPATASSPPGKRPAGAEDFERDMAFALFDADEVTKAKVELPRSSPPAPRATPPPVSPPEGRRLQPGPAAIAELEDGFDELPTAAFHPVPKAEPAHRHTALEFALPAFDETENMEPPAALHAPEPEPPPRVAPPLQSQRPERRARPSSKPPPLPLLVDVTPLSLGVETVGGYCDMVIPRNTPVPCEQSRAFATASDNQVAVHVRVCQGESSRFVENTMLGELELTGLSRARRGQVQVLVTFSLDTDGILGVHARDASTGNETSARIRLVGVSEAADVERLAARHAAHPVL